MTRKTLPVVLTALIAVVAYFVLMPVPIEPVAWEAPPNPGYTGPFAPNVRLTGIETFPIGDNHGPEDIALDRKGRIYAATHEGRIVRLQADGSGYENWAETGGRPLGIVFDNDGNLIVADALRGLLSISKKGEIKELAAIADGIPIVYANDVDVAADGTIYFSDASTKFQAKLTGNTLAASVLDLMEHGGHGRLLAYHPDTGTATTLVDGLNFANGVAVSHDQSYVLVNETGNYRVLRYWIAGSRNGHLEPLIENLPSFPDNISTGNAGRFWVAFVSPRNALLDGLSDQPFLRKMIQRLPAFLRPKAVAFGHIIAIDGNGSVVEDLQDPAGTYPINTSVTETPEYLYIGNLVAPAVGRLSKEKAGL